MDRRTLLASSVGVVVGLAGCNTDSGDTDPTDSAPPTSTPDPADTPIAERIDRYRFDLGSGTSPGDPYIEEIHVDFEPSSNAVEVASAVVVGSSSCSRAGLESVLYGKETLQVAITGEAKDHAAAYRSENTSVPCSGDIHAQAYTLRVAFDEGLPNRVVVVEPAGSGEDDDRVREVER
jgi:hypothetical protein